MLPGNLRGGRTLGGCRILPHRGRVLILRELAATAAPVALPGQGDVLWDNRFLARRRKEGAAMQIGALGVEGAASMRAIAPAGAAHHLPSIVRPSLPAFWQDGRLLAVPHLGWRRPGVESGVEIRLRPARPLSGSGFTVV
jgi:tRNA(Ile)-lysidine synthase